MDAYQLYKEQHYNYFKKLVIMAFTDNCDIFGSFHEDGFNQIVNHIRNQRPSLFNYGTLDMVGKEKIYCRPIDAHPSVKQYNNPLIDVSPYLPIPGYNGSYGISYIMQLTELLLDFHPSNKIGLPPELNPPLNKQHLALSASFCIGMGCPSEKIIDSIIDSVTTADDKDDKPTGKDDRPNEPKPPVTGIPFRELTCFCLDVFAVLHVEFINDELRLKLDGIEIVDIKPEGLENMIECYIEAVIRLSLLPKLRIKLKDLVYDIENYVTIIPTPISGNVPYNPSIADDKVSVFVNLS